MFIKNKPPSCSMVFPSHPYDVEALDMWDHAGLCIERLLPKYREEYGGVMGQWDVYNEICQECDEHDTCFKHSDWFIELVED